MQKKQPFPHKILIILAIVLMFPAHVCAAENIEPFTDKLIAEKYMYKNVMELSPSCTMHFILPNHTSDKYIKSMMYMGETLYQIDNGVNGYKGDFASYSLYNGGLISGNRIVKGNKLYLTIKERMNYEITKAQQEEYQVEKQKILKKLKLSKKSSRTAQYRNVKKIYSWVTRNVSYDYSKQKKTAYTALIDHQATCNGSSALFYDFCRDSGIPCRIIVGYTDEKRDGSHAWNIVRIGKNWYNCDPTWDEDSQYRRYFLKGNSRFRKNHIPYNRFLRKSFKRHFPISDKDYSSRSK